MNNPIQILGMIPKKLIEADNVNEVVIGGETYVISKVTDAAKKQAEQILKLDVFLNLGKYAVNRLKFIIENYW